MHSRPPVSRSATLIGLSALVIWAGYVGFIRVAADAFGPTLGAALLYTLAGAALWVTRRPRSLSTMPRRYLLIGGGLFVFYEVAVSLAIGLAHGPNQAIEVSIVNHLWPTLTVLLTVLIRPGRRGVWALVPGLVVATAGVAWVVGGERGLNPVGIIANIATNPLPYALALSGAVAWASYSVLVPPLAKGHDGITLFMCSVAVALWVLWLAGGAPAPDAVTARGVLSLIAGAAVIAAGYACWNVGIGKGNMNVLSVASYAAPVLQAAAASIILGAALSPTFWQGVALVAVGSLLCWWALRRAGR
ncbi:aromatic amino acid DMT transporter YddG [Tessaracoccus lacteus]|uniref:Aromatic amino acid DMT transporter YddG n=1 Tax=Tessaracoccus lacteus TaxID=3041766 RepID=A0ABY8Q169_9ACTN|nr:aromatic amino acid DMT transporter YddG [Tessaracoccus sp. T21]WGT48443.1 aromatic amino acid DMT transporter YddG [Tessaracoccus sp. T21]